MNMTDWATREVELACKQENPNRQDGVFDYGCACYESALKAFKSLCEDEHSGFSMSVTRDILNKLIDGKPLTPIEDTDDSWYSIRYSKYHDCDVYQNKRMFSLCKYVYNDGSIKYEDSNRIRCRRKDSHSHYTNWFVARKVSECPEIGEITMPYFPSKPITVITDECLVNGELGDFDTLAILYAELPDGKHVEINRYFKELHDEMVEITEEEWLDRFKNRIDN